MAPSVCRITLGDLFLEVRYSWTLWEKNCGQKLQQILFGQVWGNSGKNPSHTPKFASSYTCAGVPSVHQQWGGRQMPSRGPPCCGISQNAKCNLRATAATRTGCVRHGVGHQTPFSGYDSRNAAEDLRPNILQLNTEGLTADKISAIDQLAYKNKAFCRRPTAQL